MLELSDLVKTDDIFLLKAYHSLRYDHLLKQQLHNTIRLFIAHDFLMPTDIRFLDESVLINYIVRNTDITFFLNEKGEFIRFVAYDIRNPVQHSDISPREYLLNYVFDKVDVTLLSCFISRLLHQNTTNTLQYSLYPSMSLIGQ